ncbi:hypothetical protein JRQ81_017007 [Phrynocephalus forsythii]|uniref:Reverse transcriptase RNase H-like domain-containing protein n=1 Tax=Phrynocephalus forsythii TaxID=171643 RepID=A0A9Q1B1G2_9SAUR|nr:hypothetical protein JRQ81_017007 [Phrynocephalus forsythii]
MATLSLEPPPINHLRMGGRHQPVGKGFSKLRNLFKSQPGQEAGRGRGRGWRNWRLPCRNNRVHPIVESVTQTIQVLPAAAVVPAAGGERVSPGVQGGGCTGGAPPPQGSLGGKSPALQATLCGAELWGLVPLPTGIDIREMAGLWIRESHLDWEMASYWNTVQMAKVRKAIWAGSRVAFLSAKMGRAKTGLLENSAPSGVRPRSPSLPALRLPWVGERGPGDGRVKDRGQDSTAAPHTAGVWEAADGAALAAGWESLTKNLPAQVVQRLLGLVAFTTSVAKTRALQSWYLIFFDPIQDNQSKLLVSHWSSSINSSGGYTAAICLPIATDAIMQTWGAICNHLTINGTLSQTEKYLHTNHLELLAVIKAFKTYLRLLSGQVVQVVTNNTTTMHYMNKQGGTHSQGLLLLTVEFWEWCMRHRIYPIAVHLPGKENIADRLSRTTSISHKWKLHQDVFQSIVHHWGAPELDLFATPENKKCTTFCSWVPNACCRQQSPDSSLDCQGSPCMLLPRPPLLAQLILPTSAHPSMPTVAFICMFASDLHRVADSKESKLIDSIA